MKKLILYIFICLMVPFVSCDLTIPPKSNTYILETEVPIYYSLSRNSTLHFRRLDAGDSVKLRRYNLLTLSRDNRGTGIFYQIYLAHAEDHMENHIFYGLSSRDQLPIDYYYHSHIMYVGSEWEYSREHKTYTLHVTKEMCEIDSYNLGYLNPLFIYMVADNDLYSAAIETINQLESGYSSVSPIYIYLDAPKGTPHEGGTLMRLKSDNSPQVKSIILKSFGEVDSCNLEHFKKIYYSVSHDPFYRPTTILWSHGTSWLPSTMASDEINLNAFGNDESASSMFDIEALASVIDSPIVFDGCRMASAEVLRCFNYNQIVAPSVDIEPLSYPYNDSKFLYALMGSEFEKVVDMIVDYNKSRGKEISMTYVPNGDSPRHKRWGQEQRCYYKFYDFARDDFSSYLADNHGDGKEKLDFATMRPSLLQLGTTQSGKATLSYDLLSLIQEIENGTGKTELQEALKKSVYVRSTPTIWNGQESSKYCGISCYVPYHYEEDISQDLVNLNQYYLTLPWGKMIGRYSKPLVP